MRNLQKYHVSKNLFDESTLENNVGNGSDGLPYSYNGRVGSYTPILLNSDNVTITFSATISCNMIYSLFDSNDVLLRRENNITSGTTIVTTNAVKMYICFYITGNPITTDNITNVMINSGSTALPYEPYSADVWHDLAPQQYINGEFIDNANIPEKYSSGSWGLNG